MILRRGFLSLSRGDTISTVRLQPEEQLTSLSKTLKSKKYRLCRFPITNITRSTSTVRTLIVWFLFVLVAVLCGGFPRCLIAGLNPDRCRTREFITRSKIRIRLIREADFSKNQKVIRRILSRKD